MNIKINRSSQTPLYLQIKCAVQNLILSGEIAPGYKMPAERKLAEELAVHRNTVRSLRTTFRLPAFSRWKR